MLKVAGITFTKNQLRELALRIRNKPMNSNITAVGRVCDAVERNSIGTPLIRNFAESGYAGMSFRYFYIPEGLDDGKDDFDIRKYILILAIRDLEPGETRLKFNDIPLDENDLDISKALKWMAGYGYSSDELRARWMTIAESTVGS